jgi:hypothetical protein
MSTSPDETLKRPSGMPKYDTSTKAGQLLPFTPFRVHSGTLIVAPLRLLCPSTPCSTKTFGCLPQADRLSTEAP